MIDKESILHLKFDPRDSAVSSNGWQLDGLEEGRAWTSFFAVLLLLPAYADWIMWVADAAAQKLAAEVAQTWLESNYKGYLQNGGRMVEKYDGVTPGVEGGGGEYDVQTGFGWTNGVMLYFLQNYGWEPANSLADSSNLVSIDINALAASS
jgi:hypothetical protein